jgi:hypothetical protein
MKSLRAITEDSAISISLAMVLLGGMFWLGSVSAKGEQTVTRVDRLEVKQEAEGPALEAIRLDIVEMKSDIKRLLREKHLQ